MCMLQVIRGTLATVISLVALGFLAKMFGAELATGEQFENYFQWALAGGLVFLAIGIALMVFDREETVKTPLQDDSRKS